MLPEHLKIGFEVYRISVGTADFESQGELDAERGTIILTPKATERRLAAILVHEILHACWDQAELEDQGDDAKEEAIVNRLAPILAQALMDNPALLRCIASAAAAANGTCYKPSWRDEAAERLDRLTSVP